MNKRFCLLLSMGAMVLASFVFAPPTIAQTNLEKFTDSLFKANLDKSKIAGGTVIAFQKGKMLINKAYGYANLELLVPMPKQGVFEIGSVTKQFTSAAILKLANEGKLSLDDDFTKYMKFDTKGRKVTIYQLLNHTSGIPEYTQMEEFDELAVQGYHKGPLVRMVERKKFLFEPGKGMIYSNSGYFFLGLVIEKVSGKSYRDYLKDAFFTPLGLNETCYCSHRRLIKNKVEGYSYTPTKFRKKAFLNHQWPYAAGSLCSTTGDLLKWIRALHTGKVFNKKNYQTFVTPGKLSNGTSLRYAMGVMNYQYKGNPIIGHGGGIPGFLSATRYFPKQDLYIVCLVNTVGPASARFFANQLSDKILGNTKPKPKKVEIDLKKVVGNYSGQGRGRIINIKVTTQGDSVVMHMGKQKRKFSNYQGKGVWVKGSDQIKFVNGEWHWDNLAGYYILKKKS